MESHTVCRPSGYNLLHYPTVASIENQGREGDLHDSAKKRLLFSMTIGEVGSRIYIACLPWVGGTEIHGREAA